LGENDEGFGVSPLYLDENACVFSDVGVWVYCCCCWNFYIVGDINLGDGILWF
jgi:hypothetical protein